MMCQKLCVAVCLAGFSLLAQDPGINFTGVWTLDSTESEVRSSPVAAAEVFKIDHTADTIQCANGWRFKTDGSETRFAIAQGFPSSSRTKWEGRALLISSVVTGPRNYSVNERWSLSRDRNTLRIRRQIVTLQGETESNLVYQRDGSTVSSTPVLTESARADGKPAETRKSEDTPKSAETPKKELTYTVAVGTKIPLRLVKGLSTESASEGERVYLETAFPVVAEGRMVIPVGSSVAGTVTNVVRPGRIKGRGELFLRFDTLILNNGVTRQFSSRPEGLDNESSGTLDRKEGKIKTPGSKGEDAMKVGKVAATGAAVGSMAGSIGGRPGMGAAVGAAGGVATGLAGVLLSRGADTNLPRGTILEMELDRPLFFSESELGRR